MKINLAGGRLIVPRYNLDGRLEEDNGGNAFGKYVYDALCVQPETGRMQKYPLECDVRLHGIRQSDGHYECNVRIYIFRTAELVADGLFYPKT